MYIENDFVFPWPILLTHSFTIYLYISNINNSNAYFTANVLVPVEPELKVLVNALFFNFTCTGLIYFQQLW